MKITNKRLREIIKEEIEASFSNKNYIKEIWPAVARGIGSYVGSMAAEKIFGEDQIIDEDEDQDGIEVDEIIKKIGPKKYRIYSKSKNQKTGKRKNLGTFKSKKAAKKQERNIEFFKHKK